MASMNTFVSREEYKAKKALEEARKAGTAPAEVDEEGKEINPHMPQYITQAPWYLNQSQPSLKHQRARDSNLKTEMGAWYQRGARAAEAATKFRKGACENCGAMTHKTKECCERPRKVGAKYTGAQIQADEIVQDINLDFEAKRDRWNGYDPDMYSDVVQRYEIHDRLKKKFKPDLAAGAGEENQADEEFKNAEDEEEAIIGNQDPRTKTTTRNLRIREDTAKYLLNLDDKSAYYDAKSRSMRENPIPHLAPEKQMFKGDNAHRFTGDTMKMLDQERFVWENIDRNMTQDLNTVALPTGTEAVFKQLQQKRSKEVQEKADKLFGKYGGEDHLNSQMPLIVGETDRYVEFTLDGRVKPVGESKRGNRSKYEEDVFVNDHTSVWGSWWNKELGWGYACCHSNVKSSRCIGEKGKKNALLKEYKIVKAREEKLKEAEQTLKQIAGEEVIQEDKKEKVAEVTAPSKPVEEAPVEKKPVIAEPTITTAKAPEKKTEKQKPKQESEEDDKSGSGSESSSDENSSSSSGEDNDDESSSDSKSKGSPSDSESSN